MEKEVNLIIKKVCPLNDIWKVLYHQKSFNSRMVLTAAVVGVILYAHTVRIEKLEKKVENLKREV